MPANDEDCWSGPLRSSCDPFNPAKFDLCGSTRGLNGETLPRVAPEPGQNADEAEPLDTFGNDAQPKGVTEVDDRADEVLIPSRLRHRAGGAT